MIANKVLSIIEHGRDGFLGYDLSRFSFLESIFSDGCLGLTLYKESRWECDATLIKMESLDDITQLMKVYEEKFPYASHMYEDKNVLEEISKSGLAVNITGTTVVDTGNKVYRIVLYDFIEGKDLAKYLGSASQSELDIYKDRLLMCLAGLLELGFMVELKDLADFLYVDDRMILTDYNKLRDCRNATLFSKNGVKDFYTKKVEAMVTNDYVAYSASQATMV
jgi:hypothetical protein